MPITNVAKITSWNEAKGFGFAEVNRKKYFVHVSALGPITRNPRVGDSIVVTEFLETPKGPRIVLGVLEGVPLKNNQVNNKNTSGYYRKRKMNAALIILLISIPVIVLVNCQGYLFNRDETSYSAVELNQNKNKENDFSSKFNCDGRIYCSQMNSYEEALFFLRNCPGVQMDGDGDGVPCERQFGR